MKNIYRIVSSLACAGLLLAAGGCSSSGGGDSCVSTGRALCARACDCRDGAECAIASGDVDGGTGGTVTFDSRSDCDALVAFGCSRGEDPTIDYAACSSAISGGMCATDSAGNSAFVSPAACN